VIGARRILPFAPWIALDDSSDRPTAIATR